MTLGNDAAERQFAYSELFRDQLAADQVHEIREMLNQELILGREDFKDRIAQMTQRQVRRGKDGRPLSGSAKSHCPPVY
jgi:putative transposase